VPDDDVEVLMRHRLLGLSLAAVAVQLSGAAVASVPLPGIAAQASLSFENNTGSAPGVLANRGLVTLYPAGGPLFDVPNLGAVVPQDDYERNGVRLITKDGAGGPATYVGLITFLTPGQINFYASSHFINQPWLGVVLSDGLTLYVQRRISGVWTDISQGGTLQFAMSSPQTSVIYQNGRPRHNADLYGYDGTSQYVFLKKTLDGSPNPRVHNGRPTALSFYLSAVSEQGTFTICNTTLKLDGMARDELLLSTYVASGFQGVQQINVLVPEGITDETTIQFGSAISFFQSCSSPNLGNIATIPNWQ
jgi:hypothetical protein